MVGEVQNTEPTSVVESVSTEVIKPPEPSAEEKMTAMIQAEVAKAVAKETELARREIQSVKDKSKAEVESALRRVRLAESTAEATRRSLQSLDPDTAEKVELAGYRAKEQGRQSLEREDVARRQQEEFHQQFHSNLTQFITGLGVDPADQRIDWAGDATNAGNYLEAQRRVLDSVSKIQKENVKVTESNLDKKIKEAEARIAKKLGYDEVNSVSTAASVGVSSDGIPLDMAKFREWIDRIPQKEYEEKYAVRVKELRRQGKIK